MTTITMMVPMPMLFAALNGSTSRLSRSCLPSSLKALATRSGVAVLLAYPRVRAELTYAVEASLDAQTWTTVGVNQGAGAVGATVTATYTPATGQQALLRLRVTQP